MRKIIEFLLCIYAFPMNIILRILPSSKRIGLKSSYMAKLYTGDEYVRLSSFPKQVNTVMVKGTNRDFSSVAVILQGPVATKDNFTINTIKMYKKYYDGIRIIVSTWKDAEPKVIASIKTEGVDVILNEYPAVNPEGNLNYQLTTSLAGVLRARELGAKYVVKTRTDQRYYNPCALSMLQGMYQEGKLILLGGIFNSFYGRPFYISDFFAFGSIEELETLYNCEFDTEEVVRTRTEAKQKDQFKQYYDWVLKADMNCEVNVPSELEDMTVAYACPEIKIIYHYFLSKKSLKNFDTMKDAYDDFLRNNVILVDANSLGFYWLKYKYQAFNPDYFQRTGKLDAAKWYELRQDI